MVLSWTAYDGVKKYWCDALLGYPLFPVAGCSLSLAGSFLALFGLYSRLTNILIGIGCIVNAIGLLLFLWWSTINVEGGRRLPHDVCVLALCQIFIIIASIVVMGLPSLQFVSWTVREQLDETNNWQLLFLPYLGSSAWHIVRSPTLRNCIKTITAVRWLQSLHAYGNVGGSRRRRLCAAGRRQMSVSWHGPSIFLTARKKKPLAVY